MAYTTINKPNEHFVANLRTGYYAASGTTNVNIGFTPDLVWDKNRDAVSSHDLIDSVRGGGNQLKSSSSYAESAGSNIGSFIANGFQVVNFNDHSSAYNIVDWCWKANGAGVANTAGTISSTVSANTTNGFSIVSYTGDGVNNRTVGHGLGATPKFVIIKNRSAGAAYWSVINPRSTSTSDTNILYLNRADAEADDTNIMGTNLPNSTTFGIGNYSGVNVNGENFIAYCFTPIKGYSSFGSYVGNGNANGTFVYTGFKPAYLMIKNANQGAGFGFWSIWDNKRNSYNPEINYLIANSTDAEGTGEPGGVDFLSNGFKLRNAYDYSNASSINYVYMCFAEQPLVGTNNVPCTAR